jgi:hypothetical protein
MYFIEENCAIMAPRDKMNTKYKKENFPWLNPEREVAKLVFECGGQDCRIISDNLGYKEGIICPKILS